MTENRRIFLNVIATYGRSIYGLILGLLCGRWALMALGEIDYGLYGLVGGLTVFIAFFNNILAGANARFYAVSIGAVKSAADKTAALEECRRWFNTALSVHAAVPLILIIVGYPLGVWAIENWLTIPTERISDCVWVFRFVCLNCFVGMLNVPFSAMYGAKQYIAELTIYSFVTSTLNVCALGYMVTHPGIWLAKYAAWMCVISVVPQLIICVRACVVFPECRIKRIYLWDPAYIRRLGVYSFWQFIGVLCGMLRTSGITIVINKFFGAAMNAAQAIGNTVQAQCNTLAGAMQSAFVPVITQACGAGDYVKMNKFVLRVCKFNVFLSFIFMIPLALELPEVMRLWLKNPPSYTTGLCYCAMLLYLSGACTVGHMVAVNAVGKIAGYYMVLGAVNIFVLPVAITVGYFYRNVYAVMGTVIFFECLNSLGRMVFARRHARSSVWAWIKGVAVSAIVTLAISLPLGYSVRFFMIESFIRVVVTTIVCEAVLLPTLWFVILNNEERDFIRERVLDKIIKKFCK